MLVFNENRHVNAQAGFANQAECVPECDAALLSRVAIVDPYIAR